MDGGAAWKRTGGVAVGERALCPAVQEAFGLEQGIVWLTLSNGFVD